VIALFMEHLRARLSAGTSREPDAATLLGDPAPELPQRAAE